MKLEEARVEQYHNLLKRLLVEGDRQYNERTGHLMIGKGGHSSRYELSEGFPLVTTKQMFFRGIAEELLWFARGERNVRPLIDRGVHIWDRNAYQHHLKRNGLDKTIKKNTAEWEDGCKEFISRIRNDDAFAAVEGDLGPVYGYQWRHWNNSDGSGERETDQLKNIFVQLNKDLGTRYAMLSAWKPDNISDCALPPCHCIAQFNVWENKFLDITMFQRSCDSYLGVPFNIASYPLLGSLIAKELGLEIRTFDHHYGNIHIYGGVGERSNFLRDDNNLKTFREKVKGITDRAEYLAVKEWYLKSAPSEGEVNARKDHIPFILEQLSHKPKILPTLEVISNKTFFETINLPADEVWNLKGYNPDKWDSKAEMAA